MDVSEFKKLPVMGILRGVGIEVAELLAQTIVSSGLSTVEVTMNTPGASELIRRFSEATDGQLTIGAGTVLTIDDLGLALDAGATFIVMPTLVPDVVRYCRDNFIPVFPGALTPQEVYNAWIAGATMVKVFPARFFGPEYLKELNGPFSEIETLACGGVTADNVNAFFSCGASAVAIGGSVFNKELIEARQFSHIQEQIELIISRVRSVRGLCPHQPCVD